MSTKYAAGRENAEAKLVASDGANTYTAALLAYYRSATPHPGIPGDAWDVSFGCGERQYESVRPVTNANYVNSPERKPS